MVPVSSPAASFDAASFDAASFDAASFDAAAFDAVLFAGEGVLADSRPIVGRVLAEMVQLLGCPLPLAELRRCFAGTPMTEVVQALEAKLGHRLPSIWHSQFAVRRAEALRRELRAAPGVPALLQALDGAGVTLAVVAPGEPESLASMLQLTALSRHFQDRVFTPADDAHGAAASALYVRAAQTLGVAPGRCAVVESSVAGASAAASTGMTVFGMPGSADAAELQAAGAAAVLTSVEELAPLVGLGVRAPVAVGFV
jgi:beta-phosphoglucomutase-like phosphatase (HAD superfamily)